MAAPTKPSLDCKGGRCMMRRKHLYALRVRLGHNEVYGTPMGEAELRHLTGSLPPADTLAHLAFLGAGLACREGDETEQQIRLATRDWRDPGGCPLSRALMRGQGSCIWLEPIQLFAGTRLLAQCGGAGGACASVWDAKGVDTLNRWLLGVSDWLNRCASEAQPESGRVTAEDALRIMLPGTAPHLAQVPKHLLGRASFYFATDLDGLVADRTPLQRIRSALADLLSPARIEVVLSVLAAALAYYGWYGWAQPYGGDAPGARNPRLDVFAYLVNASLEPAEIEAAMAFVGWGLEAFATYEEARWSAEERDDPRLVVSALARPLLKVAEREWVCVYPPLITDFAWDGIYFLLQNHWLDGTGQPSNDFTQAWGDALEQYMRSLVEATFPTSSVLCRRTWFDEPGQYSGRRGARPPDATILYPEGVAMLEVTAAKPRAGALMLGQPDAIHDAARKLAAKCVQVGDRARDYTDGELRLTGHERSPGERVLPVVVVGDRLPLSPWFGELVEAGRDPRGGMPDILPSQVITLSDLELLLASGLRGASVWEVLADRAVDPVGRWWPLWPWWEQRGDRLPATTHPLLERLFTDFFARIADACGFDLPAET